MTVLIAGFGNVLRGDDAFGVVVAEELSRRPLPADVEVIEVGIGGMVLVETLLDPYDGLIAIDAVDVGRPPGTVVVIRPDVQDLRDLPLMERSDQLADVHRADPARVFTLARSMGTLPVETWVVGCQPTATEVLMEELSEPVAHAVETAIAEVQRLVTGLGIEWT